MNSTIKILLPAMAIAASAPLLAQEVVECGEGSYASYAPWRLARSTRHWGDQSRLMQTRPLYMTRRRKGSPIPTNDWWTDALVERWTGNLWSYPAKTKIDANGVRVAFPSYWIDDGTEMKEKSALVVGSSGDFSPDAALVDDWHDWDVEMVLVDGAKEIRTTLVHGSPFVWIEAKGTELKVNVEALGDYSPRRIKKKDGEMISVGDETYGVWTGKNKSGEWVAIGLLPDEAAYEKLAPYATSVIRSTRVDWKYDEKSAVLSTTWNVETEDIRKAGSGETKPAPVALQGFQPHHMKKTAVHFRPIEGLVWQTPRGRQVAAAGNNLQIDYAFPGLLPYWAAPSIKSRAKSKSSYDEALFKDLLSDYASRGGFGGDTYWGGKGLLQMAFAMMAARELGDEATFRKAHSKLRAKFEDWLGWNPQEERFFFSYVPKWGGMVGEGTSYDSDTFNDHHFHYGYFTYAGALLCMVDPDFKEKFAPMLRLVAKDYANWERPETSRKSHDAVHPAFPLFRTFDPWAGHSFAGGIGDGGGNGQESSSEAMQGWGGLYFLGLALGDDAMRDAGIFGYVSEARGTAEYWFDRDRENIDYTKFKHPYNSNLTCHGVGWWTYFSGDPVWMHSIQWLPNTPVLDYLSEDLKFAKWDWEQMWEKKEIGGWFEKGRDRNGNPTDCVGDASLGNVLLSYLQRHDPVLAAEIFAKLREKRLGAAMNADTAHMTYWAVHSHLSWGELDFGVRADYPCARAFVKDGKRTLMVYNASETPRKVVFFDAATSKPVGEVEANPLCLTLKPAGSRSPVSSSLSPISGSGSMISQSLVPKGVSMPDLALGKKVVVSSQENGGMPGSNMVDGDDSTRWGSDHSETELTAAIDLGEEVSLYSAELKWENSHASKYLFQISRDGVKWTTLGGERNGFEGLQRLDFAGEKTRWVRVKGLEKATQYGISLFRFSVYGKRLSRQNAGEGGERNVLGLKIETDKAVLKEGSASKMSAKAWLGGDKFKDVPVEWSTGDGTFEGDSFTPATNGFARVSASYSGFKAEWKFPVEEKLSPSTLLFDSTNLVAIAGEGVKIGLSAADQFGGRMSLKGLKLAVYGPGARNTRAVNGKDFKMNKDWTFIPSKPGVYTIEARFGGLSATAKIDSKDAKNVNFARLSSVTSSGEENGGLKAAFAADGNMSTRWSSRHRDGEWIKFDFGVEREISRIAIDWENARAEKYVVETSCDGKTWQEAARVAHNGGGRLSHEWNRRKARYLRITGTERNTAYGISIFEVDIR